MNRRFNVISLIGDKKTRIPIRDIENETIKSLIKKIEKRNIFTDESIYALKTKSGEWLYKEDHVIDLLNHGDTVICIFTPPPYPLSEDVLLKFSQFDPPTFPVALQPNSFKKYVQTILRKKTDPKLQEQTKTNNSTNPGKDSNILLNAKKPGSKQGLTYPTKKNISLQKNQIFAKNDLNEKQSNKSKEEQFKSQVDLNSLNTKSSLSSQFENENENEKEKDKAYLSDKSQEKLNSNPEPIQKSKRNTNASANTVIKGIGTKQKKEGFAKIANLKKEKKNQNSIVKKHNNKNKKERNLVTKANSSNNSQIKETKETDSSLKNNMNLDHLNIDLSEEIFEKIDLKQTKEQKKKNFHRSYTPQPKVHRKIILDLHLTDKKPNKKQQNMKNKLTSSQSSWEDLSIQRQNRKLISKNLRDNKLNRKKNVKKQANIKKETKIKNKIKIKKKKKNENGNENESLNENENKNENENENKNKKKSMETKIANRLNTKKIGEVHSDLDESTWEEIDFYNSIQKERRTNPKIKNNLYSFTHLIDNSISLTKNELLEKNDLKQKQNHLNAKKPDKEKEYQNLAFNNNNNLNKFNEKIIFNNINSSKRGSRIPPLQKVNDNTENNNINNNINKNKSNKIKIKKNISSTKNKSKPKNKNNNTMNPNPKEKLINFQNKKKYQKLHSSEWVELVQLKEKNSKNNGHSNSKSNRVFKNKNNKKKNHNNLLNIKSNLHTITQSYSSDYILGKPKKKYGKLRNQPKKFKAQDQFNKQNINRNNHFDFRSHDSFSDNSFKPVKVSKKKHRVSPLEFMNITDKDLNNRNNGNYNNNNNIVSGNMNSGSSNNNNGDNNNSNNQKEKRKKNLSQRSGYFESFNVICLNKNEYLLEELTIIFSKRKIEIYHSNNLIFTILLILINIKSNPDHETSLMITSLNNKYIFKFANVERLKTFTKLFLNYKHKIKKKKKKKEQFLVSFSGNEAKKGLIIIKYPQIKLVLLYKNSKTIKGLIKEINFFINKQKKFILLFEEEKFEIQFMNNIELEQFTQILNSN
ncbi:nnp-1 protein putative nuclear protein 1 nop52 [Anaeramoeba flamelloides]|uniref:Nnp-1 protein putative nuclear protein 1 nop52 n=1 Tax=Anaeramoeba flamelloides TaxID=1746091 RepID=A0ABQ8YT07_9EUKA|nr:nnp-1 protein putative nuclear protein 1 nop52 [Anaeramoeba flamelloides]